MMNINFFLGNWTICILEIAVFQKYILKGG